MVPFKRDKEDKLTTLMSGIIERDDYEKQCLSSILILHRVLV